MRSHIDYILDDIFVFLYLCLSYLIIESLTGYKNITRKGNFPGYGIPGTKMCKNSCRKPGYETFPGYGNFQDIEYLQDMEVILDIEVKHNKIYRKTIVRSKFMP